MRSCPPWRHPLHSIVYPTAVATPLPPFPPRKVFKRVRLGESQLESVAEGSLALLREVAKRAGGLGGGGGVSEVGSWGGAGSTVVRDFLLTGLEGAGPLLLHTDSHGLLQVCACACLSWMVCRVSVWFGSVRFCCLIG